MERHVVAVNSTDPEHRRTLGNLLNDRWDVTCTEAHDDDATWVGQRVFPTAEEGHDAVAALDLPEGTVSRKVRGTMTHAYLIGEGTSLDAFQKLLSTIDPPTGNGSPGDASSDKPADKPADGPKDEAPKKPDVPAIVDPLAGLQEKMWSALPADDQKSQAQAYFNQAVAAYRTGTAAAQWATAPELAALLLVKDDNQETFAEELFYAKAGISRFQDGLDATGLTLAVKRTQLATVGVGMAEEFLTQTQRWRSLSQHIVAVLVTGGAVFALGTIGAFFLTAFGKVDGPSLALIIFVLAVTTISPAALLLLQRPLKGIDSFSPAGSSTSSAGDDNSAGGTSGAATASTKATS